MGVRSVTATVGAAVLLAKLIAGATLFLVYLSAGISL
jgi:hypothetical protein